MCYASVWPKGKAGRHISIATEGKWRIKVRHNNVIMREYVSYNHAVRGKPPFGEFNPVLNAKRLIQQLIIDYYCLIEGDRLKCIRNQQD